MTHPTPKDWRGELFERIDEYYRQNFDALMSEKRMFIRELTDYFLAREREEMVKVLEGMRKDECWFCKGKEEWKGRCSHDAKEHGYNQALDQAIVKIKDHKETDTPTSTDKDETV